MPEDHGDSGAERDAMISSGDPRVSATVVCMSDPLLFRFLADNGIHDKNDLIALVQAVAKIPWGEARTVSEVLQKNKGTCTGKHLLLQACFDDLSIMYRPVVCTFRWEKQGIDFPEDLRAILKQHTWDHGHNFVQIKNGKGVWIDVDITWDSPLERHGFRVFPKDWNGTSSFVGIHPIERRWDGVNIAEMKEQLIERLTPEQKNARSIFLKGFIAWIDLLRV